MLVLSDLGSRLTYCYKNLIKKLKKVLTDLRPYIGGKHALILVRLD